MMNIVRSSLSPQSVAQKRSVQNVNKLR